MIAELYNLGLGLWPAPWWTTLAWPILWNLVKIVAVLLPLMGCVAYLTLWERKAIGWTQIRPGPNRVGPYGLLTPIADAVKLIFKEIIRLARHHGTMVVHDFAYADLCFDGYKAPSILQVEGAKEYAVEIEIRSVWPGSKYRDTVISGVRTFVDSDAPYDAAFEQAKRVIAEAERKRGVEPSLPQVSAGHAIEAYWRQVEAERRSPRRPVVGRASIPKGAVPL